jgi:hypothetical protein
MLVSLRIGINGHVIGPRRPQGSFRTIRQCPAYAARNFPVLKN